MSETAVHDALTTHTDEYEIVRELHRVRPHATYEVRFRGERAVCKVETHPEADLGAEAAVMRYVAESTSVPVPELLAVGSGGDGVHSGTGSDGEVTAVIDFEHALAAPAEWDYLRTVLPVFGPGADHDVPESVFREAYESVRPLPAGFDRRREALKLCNGLSDLRSLHLQRGDQDPPHAVGRRARAMAASLRDRLTTLRGFNDHLPDA